MQTPRSTSRGYAEAAEGLRVHYEICGEGEPILVMPGGLMDITSLAQVIRPLSRERQANQARRTTTRPTRREPRP